MLENERIIVQDRGGIDAGIALQNAITSGFNTLSNENATRFNILGAKIDAQTQIINDKFCQLEKCKFGHNNQCDKRFQRT